MSHLNLKPSIRQFMRIVLTGEVIKRLHNYKPDPLHKISDKKTDQSNQLKALGYLMHASMIHYLFVRCINNSLSS